MEKKEYQLNFNVDISALTEVKNILQDISLQLQELGKQTEKDIFGKMFDFADKASSIGSFFISLFDVIKGADKEAKKIAGAMSKQMPRRLAHTLAKASSKVSKNHVQK